MARNSQDWDKSLTKENLGRLGFPQLTVPVEEDSEYGSLSDLIPDNSPSLSSFFLEEVVDLEVFDKKISFQEKLEIN